MPNGTVLPFVPASRPSHANRARPRNIAPRAARPKGCQPAAGARTIRCVTATAPGLARRMGTADAVLVGLGSMIGAGVFAVFGPAARAAGSGLLLGLAVAAVIAYCNATASAQLAAVYPASGGTYVYGRERLGEWWGFAAGWAFVVGKTASCAAMALTFAAYAVPGPWWVQRLAAVAAVAGLAAVNYRGVTRTVALTRVLVGCTLAALAVVVAAIWAHGATLANLGGPAALSSGGVYGTLQAAGLIFFAFAGYARIATMGEEVRDPARTIPRAIPLALGIAVAVYLAVGVSALAAAHPRYRVPHRAEVALAAVVCALVLATVLRTAIGFSSTGVLLYYAIANASAFTQPAEQRRWPRALQVLGGAGCLVLVAGLPATSLVAGLAGRLAVRRLSGSGRAA